MPYDLAKETGTWETGKYSDNYPQILEKLGVPKDMLSQVMAEKYVIEVTVSGNTCTHKMTEFGQTSVNTFTFGVEGDETDSFGTRRVTHTMDGDTVTSHYPNMDGKGLVFTTTRRWVDDNTIHAEMKVGDLEGWVENKRV